ncbi:50S ribosomal protein L3 [bacterium]|nr:MAG: 50S ribosomal protein L3 [bacterium]
MNEDKKDITKDLDESKVEDVVSKESSSQEEVNPADEVSANEANTSEKAESPEEDIKSDEKDNSEDKINPYAKFLLGTKIGMTNVFTDSGMAHPATVIEAGPCFVSQIKNHISDGYNSVQIGFKMDRKANKPKKNHFEKNKCEPLKHVKEFRINEDSVFALGEKIDVKVFSVGEYVNVTGTSKGKGFAGVMKRHGFAGGRASHGKNSVMRKPGSVGAGADPSRIWKGKKMPGRYGGYTVTCKNLEILKIDVENNLLFIKGAVPGANNNLVSIAI